MFMIITFQISLGNPFPATIFKVPLSSLERCRPHPAVASRRALTQYAHAIPLAAAEPIANGGTIF
ncbi:hypothetical protein, partial [Novosphingobium rosa]|uniref:hypothetical protein n=1 Tax=Novosphingobium rosa TaxID=76978 RepID=UPI001C3FDFDF